MDFAQTPPRSPFRRAAIHAIETYRREVGPKLAVRCHFEPSCSAYGLELFRRHSLPRSVLLLGARLVRCARSREYGVADPPP